MATRPIDAEAEETRIEFAKDWTKQHLLPGPQGGGINRLPALPRTALLIACVLITSLAPMPFSLIGLSAWAILAVYG